MSRSASREVKHLRLLIGVVAGIVVGTIHALVSHAIEVSSQQSVMEIQRAPVHQGRVPDALDSGAPRGVPVGAVGR